MTGIDNAGRPDDDGIVGDWKNASGRFAFEIQSLDLLPEKLRSFGVEACRLSPQGRGYFWIAVGLCHTPSKLDFGMWDLQATRFETQTVDIIETGGLSTPPWTLHAKQA